MRFRRYLTTALLFTLFSATAGSAQTASVVPSEWSSDSPSAVLRRTWNGWKQVIETLTDQEPLRTIIPINPKIFDRFVGVYEITPVGVFHFYRNGEHYFELTTGTGLFASGKPVEIFPESSDTFFAKSTSQEFEFVSNRGGQVTGLVFRWLNTSGNYLPKVDAAVAQRGEAALKAHIRSHTADPDMAAALRRAIDGYIKDEPVYSKMTPEFAQETLKFVSDNPDLPSKLGRLKSLTFQNVDGIGADNYEADFENAKTEWRVMPLTPDGKLFNVSFYIGLYPWSKPKDKK